MEQLRGNYANKNDWVGIAAVNTNVYLNEGTNTIRLYNDEGYAPSIDRIAIVNSADEVIGDVNADGKFSVVDLVMMQKFLLNNGELTDWKAGDLCSDERIDVFDMVMMRQLILK